MASEDGATPGEELASFVEWHHIADAVAYGANLHPPQTLMECFKHYHRDFAVDGVRFPFVLDAYGEQALRDAIEIHAEFQFVKPDSPPMTVWNQWDWLPELLSTVTNLSCLRDGLRFSCDIFQVSCQNIFTAIGEGILGREDLVILAEDETFLELCQKAVRAGEWPLLASCSRQIRAIELSEMAVGCSHRSVTVEDLLPRSLRFVDEVVAKSAKEAVAMMTFKAAGPHLPPELLTMVQEQILRDYELPIGDVEITGPAAWKPCAVPGGWRSVLTYQPVQQPKNQLPVCCCDAAFRVMEEKRRGSMYRGEVDWREGHMLIWSLAEQKYISYHCVELDDPELPHMGHSWIRCLAQPRPANSTARSDEYLYSFLSNYEECFEDDPEKLTKGRL